MDIELEILFHENERVPLITNALETTRGRVYKLMGFPSASMPKIFLQSSAFWFILFLSWHRPARRRLERVYWGIKLFD